MKPWTEAKLIRSITNAAINNPPNYVKTVEGKGRGLFASRDIAKDEIVGLFTGKVITKKDLNNMESEVDVEAMVNLITYINEYAMNYKGGSLVPEKDSIGTQLCNHSCESNCSVDTPKKYKNIFDGGRNFKNALPTFAIKDICKDEELTIYYGWTGPTDRPDCLCGTKSCTGKMSIKIDFYPEESTISFDNYVLADFMHNAIVNDNHAMKEHIYKSITEPLGCSMPDDAVKEIYVDSMQVMYRKYPDMKKMDLQEIVKNLNV